MDGGEGAATRLFQKLEGGMTTRGGGWGIVLDRMHGRSRMTIDPSIPTTPGRSTCGFHGGGGSFQTLRVTNPDELVGGSSGGHSGIFVPET